MIKTAATVLIRFDPIKSSNKHCVAIQYWVSICGFVILLFISDKVPTLPAVSVSELGKNENSYSILLKLKLSFSDFDVHFHEISLLQPFTHFVQLKSEKKNF